MSGGTGCEMTMVGGGMWMNGWIDGWMKTIEEKMKKTTENRIVKILLHVCMQILDIHKR